MSENPHEPKGRDKTVAELKAFAKISSGLEATAKEVLRGVFTETDRGAVILLATTVEDIIQRAMEFRKFVRLSSDERSRIFGPDAPLGTLSAKIRFCHALGMVTRDEMRALNLLREMRNACAHSRGQFHL